MKRLKITEFAEFLGVKSGGFSQISDYEIDSRNVKTGGCFFALKGARTDGHNYLQEVADRGAICAVVNKDYEGPDFGLELLRVEDVGKSLQVAALKLLEKKRGLVIGITGSLGKTTTKEFTYTLLSKRFKVFRSPGNYNTEITVPLTVLNREGDEDILLLEMGMTRKGHIQDLVQIVAPDIALVTNVDYVHVGNFFDGLEGIARAKSEIFSQARTRGKLISPSLAKYEVFSGAKPFEIEEWDLPFSEKHFVKDFLAAAAIAKEVGMTRAEIEERIPHLKRPQMRFEKVEMGGVTYINDAYNASPTSTKFALQSMQGIGRKIAVLGQMVQMGDFSDEAHRRVGEDAGRFADLLLCTGERCGEMLRAFSKSGKVGKIFPDLRLLADYLKSIVRPGDVVLVKASRAYEFEKIFSYLS